VRLMVSVRAAPACYPRALLPQPRVTLAELGPFGVTATQLAPVAL
jgi:hypothetical protein